MEKKVIYKYDNLSKFIFEVVLDSSDDVELFVKDNQVTIVSVE